MHERELMKKVTVRAATAPGSVISGAAALFASAALANPLPLIFWGVGATVHVFRHLSNPGKSKYAREIMEEATKARTSKVENERTVLRRRVETLLGLFPFREWISGRSLPDYREEYRWLFDLRERIAEVAHRRNEVEETVESDISAKLDQMLTAFLKFVEARLKYVQILTGAQVERPTRPVTDVPLSKPRGSKVLRVVREQFGLVLDTEEEAPEVPPFSPRMHLRRDAPEFDLGAKQQELEAKIADLERDKKRRPAAAKVLESRIELLRRRQGLVKEFHDREERVAAQLEGFRDVFTFIFERLSATEFSAGELTGYIGSVVEQVEETERFVEAMRPMIDQEFGGLDVASLTEGA